MMPQWRIRYASDLRASSHVETFTSLGEARARAHALWPDDEERGYAVPSKFDGVLRPIQELWIEALDDEGDDWWTVVAVWLT